jgi:N-acetylmuramic acid 6-phosphate etherase
MDSRMAANAPAELPGRRPQGNQDVPTAAAARRADHGLNLYHWNSMSDEKSNSRPTPGQRMNVHREGRAAMKLESTTPTMSKPGRKSANPPAAPLDTRLTEQRNPRSMRIDQLSTAEIVDLINAEDRMVAAAVGEERQQIARAIDLVVDSLRKGGRLIYVGAGTSGRLGVLDASEMPPTYRTEPELVQGVIAGGFEALIRAQEGAEDHPEHGAAAMDEKNIGENDFVLGIATSGTTPYVHGALKRARERGARTGFLLCTYPSEQLIKAHDVVIAPLVGPEVITGSTRMKAGTATKIVLNTISTAAMVKTGKVYGNLMVDLQVTCQKLQDRGERILMDTLGVTREQASQLLDASGGHVKTAIVMSRLSLGADDARRRLESAGGSIADVVGDLGSR